MSTAKRFIKSSAIYFAGTVLTKLMTLFLMPLLTKYLAESDLGFFDQSTIYLTVLVSVVCIEIWASIMRFMYDYVERENKYKAVFNGLLVFSVSLLLYCLVFFFISSTENISRLFFAGDGGVDYARYLPYIFFYGICTMLQHIYTSIARGLGENSMYALSGIVNSAVNGGLCVLLILKFGLTIDAMYISALAGFASQILLLESKVKVRKNMSLSLYDKKLVFRMIKFSIPLAVNSICFWFLTSYNRTIIHNTMGFSANGIYGVAARFGAMMTFVSTCFNLAWEELAYSKGEEGGKSQLYSSAIDYYYQFIMAGVALLLPVIQLTFTFIINDRFAAAYSLVPLNLVAIGLSILSLFFGNTFAAEKDTKSIFFTTLAGAILNIATLHLLFQNLGMEASNIALIVGFGAMSLLRYFLLRRSVHLALNHKTNLILTIWMIVSVNIYLYNSNLLSLLFFVVTVGLLIFIFRDLLKMGWDTLKRIRSKN